MLVRNGTTTALFGVSLILLASCGDTSDSSQRQAPPPAKVAFVEVKQERIPVVSELPGRIAPMVTAQVRAQVTGVIRERVFIQGSDVTQGDLLYVIEPAPFEAKVRSAKAVLESARAAQSLALQQAQRQEQLRRSNVGSAQDTESAAAALAQANADVDRAEADLQTAQLDLQYTQVRAPISGRTGRAIITEGALVGPTTDPLVTISQIDPVYADFTQPVESMLRLKNAVASGGLKSDAEENAVMRLVFEEGREYPQQGKLLFSEAAVNSSTGQVILRGEFPNTDQNLLPGMYVRGRIEQAALEHAIAVPKQSVQHNSAGKATAFVVTTDDKIEEKEVTIGWGVGARWVIVSGLSAGDKVVVEGQQRVSPGTVVSPAAWPGPSTVDTSSKEG